MTKPCVVKEQSAQNSNFQRIQSQFWSRKNFLRLAQNLCQLRMEKPKAYSTDNVVHDFISVDHELVWVHGVITENEAWHDESHCECDIYGINTMMDY